MINFSLYSSEELHELITRFNQYYIEKDIVTFEPILQPCRFILEDEKGERTLSVQIYNIGTLDILMREATARRQEVKCPITLKKIVGKEDDEEGISIINSVYSSLYEAVTTGDVAEIARWLSAGGDPNQTVIDIRYPEYSFNGGTLLHWACLKGDEKKAALLIEQGAEINQPHEGDNEAYSGKTPLFIAMGARRTKVLQLLAEKGADLNLLQAEGRDKGESALFRAIYSNYCTAIKLLLQFGVNVNQLQGEGVNKGRTALHVALSFGMVKNIKLLLQNGADPNQHQGEGYHEGQTPLHAAVSAGCSVEVIELLIEQGADVFDSSLESFDGRLRKELLDVTNKKRESINIIIQYMANTIIAKKLSSTAPEEAEKLPLCDLTNNLRINWLNIRKVKRNCNEICAALVQTDLTVDAIKEALEELMLPAVENSGEAILHMANNKRKALSNEERASSSTEEVRRVMQGFHFG